MTSYTLSFDESHSIFHQEYTNNIGLLIAEFDLLFPKKPRHVFCTVFFDHQHFQKLATEYSQTNVTAFIPSDSADTLFIFHNPVFEKSIRRSIFKHELSHLYINCVNKNLPEVLKEGIAVYVSEQIFESEKNVVALQNFPIKNYSDFQSVQTEWQALPFETKYFVAGSIVRILVQQQTWKIFINSLK